MKKCIISYKTNNYLAKFLKNHLTLGRTRNIIPPTMVQEEDRWNLSRVFDMLQYFEAILPSLENL